VSAASIGLASAALAVGALGAWALGRRRARRVAELVARAAHEIRTPLAAAHLALHAAARDDGPPARLAGVDLQLQRAALAVADLAGAPHDGRPVDRPGVVDVRGLLDAQLRAWAPTAVARGREIRLAPTAAGMRVAGDRVRLSQALGNLVANALEHGHGTVVLAARAAGGRVRLEVSDDGPGLPATAAELAARRRRRRAGGRGRGLAIVHEIAARHGGRLEATADGSGTRVSLELPPPSHDDVAPAAAHA
jgi:signal transduction histidine kinase